VIPCPVCDGSGELDASDPGEPPESYMVECWRCEGDGWIFDEDEDFDGPGDSLVPRDNPPTGGQAWADRHLERVPGHVSQNKGDGWRWVEGPPAGGQALEDDE
jgi:hypothetical protein